MLEWPGGPWDEAARWKQPKLDGAVEDQHQGEPETRDGYSDYRQKPRNMIYKAILVYRGCDTKRNGKQNAEREGEDHDLQGDWQCFRHFGRNRQARNERPPQVAVNDCVAKPSEVLGQQSSIKSIRVFELAHLFRSSIRPEHDQCRRTWNEMGQTEYYGADDYQDEDRKQCTTDDKQCHQRGISSDAASRRSILQVDEQAEIFAEFHLLNPHLRVSYPENTHALPTSCTRIVRPWFT